MKNTFISMGLLLMSFLCLSCSKNIVKDFRFEETAYYHLHQLNDFEAKVKMLIQDKNTYDQYFKHPPSLVSHDLPNRTNNPNYWSRKDDLLGSGILKINFGIISSPEYDSDTIIHQMTSIAFEKMDFEVGDYWLPVGIQDEVTLPLDISQTSHINWKSKLEENRDLVTNLNLSNNINFVPNKPLSNYHLNTLHGIYHSSFALSIPLASLTIKSKDGTISFYRNLNSFGDQIEEFDLEKASIKKRDLNNYGRKNQRYNNLEYFVYWEWEEI
ncbi:MAG: hypothetical protein R8P61_37160 [Bacteroidia bacterium]|nr:hypothetical protein [Bacteroidia bacterium]